jgi:hypothetical protein
MPKLVLSTRPIKFAVILVALSPLSFASAVALSASPNPSQFGAPVTLTALVTPSASTGKVAFYAGVTVLGTATLSSGKAAFTTRFLPPGNQQLKARYLGDSSNASASSNTVSQTVNAVASVSFISEYVFPVRRPFRWRWATSTETAGPISRTRTSSAVT